MKVEASPTFVKSTEGETTMNIQTAAIAKAVAIYATHFERARVANVCFQHLAAFSTARLQ